MSRGSDDYWDDDDDRDRDYDIRRRTPPPINNYLAPAILTTLFCCTPFGIVAIVYAAQVNSKQAMGDYEGAEDSANKAKTWCWVAFASWLAFAFIYVVFMVLATAGGGIFR